MLNTTRGSGNVITESRPVSGIRAVELDTSGQLSVTQGDTESLSIEAEDNLLPLLTSDVVNGTLKLGITTNGSFTNTKPLRYILMVKDLAAIELNGSGSITVGAFSTSSALQIEGNGSGGLTFDSVQSGDATVRLSGSGSLTMTSLAAGKATLQLNGSGNLNLATLQVDSLSARLSGHGSLSVGGSAVAQNVNITGSGSYHGDGLSSRTAVISTTGSGSAVVQVSDTLEASIMGSGSISYIGSPAVTASRIGSGKIQQRA